MRQTLRVVLFDEYTFIYPKHFHIGLTLNFLLITNRPEETPRSIFDFDERFRAIIVITNTVNASHNLICSSCEITHIIRIERWIFTHVFVIIRSGLFVSSTMIRVQHFTNMVSRCVELNLLKSRVLIEMVRNRPKFLFYT